MPNRRPLPGIALLLLVVAGAARAEAPVPVAPAPPDDVPALRRVEPADATASSYLRSRWNPDDENYTPRHVLDGDPATAWQEGAPGSGAGQWLALALPPMIGVTRLQFSIRAGYARTEALWRTNGAPAEVRITLADADGGVLTTRTARLLRTMDWQEIAVPATPAVRTVRLEIVSTYEDGAYADTCISDVEVRADAAPDAEGDAARAAATSAWIEARRAAAAARPRPAPLYAGASVPWVETRYAGHAANPHPDAWAAMKDLDERLGKRGVIRRMETVGAPAVPPRQSAPPRARRSDAPESTLPYLDALGPALHLATLHLAEPSGAVRSERRSVERDVETTTTVENPRVLLDAAGEVLALGWDVDEQRHDPRAIVMHMYEGATRRYVVACAGGRAVRFRVQVSESQNEWEVLGVLHWTDDRRIRAIDYLVLDRHDGPAHEDVWKAWTMSAP